MKMLKVMKSVPLIALFGFIFCATIADAAPYQELEPRKGYVPVYIRVGDTPLSEIHPKLAEAFHESFKSADLKLEIESKTNENEADGTLFYEKKTDTATDKAKSTDEVKEVEMPATDVEGVKIVAESDIASFDVVKGTSDDDKDKNEKDEAKKQE